MESRNRPVEPSRGRGHDRSQELEWILAGYVERLNAGEELDPEQITAEHPDDASEIIRQLQTFEVMDSGFEAPLGTLGDYTLRREIGRGGMGVVYDAWQNSVDRRVALKVLPAGVAADTKSVTRFVREAKTAAQLSHPSVVAVHGMGVEENTPYYAMELVEGETLGRLNAALRSAADETDTPFGRKNDVAYFANLARAFADVADGLQHAHSRGVIHRDIKPSNLILDSQTKLRILDFGLARLEGQQTLTLSGDLMGTVLYMSPEQAMAKRVSLDHRTDVYSLGATMYETLTGEPPFRGKDQQDTLSRILVRDPRPLRQLNRRTPRDLETIVLKCLRKDPRDRYGTAEALAQDLRRFVRGDAIEARPPSSLGIVRRRLWRARYRVVLAAALTCLAFVVALLWLERQADEARGREAHYEALIYRAVVDTSTSSFPGRLEGGRVSGRQRMSPASVSEKRLRSTLEAMDEAARLLPEHPAARYQKARALRGLGDTRGALHELDDLLDRIPGYVPGRLLRARLREEDGQLEAADRDLAELDLLGVAWGREWHGATGALERGAWKEAASAYTRLIVAHEKGELEGFLGLSLELRVGRAIAHFELGDLRKAERDLVRANERWPEAILPATLLAHVYIVGGQPEQASEWFHEYYERAANPAQVAVAAVSAFATGELEFCDYQLEWLRKQPPGLERDQGASGSSSARGHPPGRRRSRRHDPASRAHRADRKDRKTRSPLRRAPRKGSRDPASRRRVLRVDGRPPRARAVKRSERRRIGRRKRAGVAPAR